MKSSDISSASATTRPHGAPTRERHALTGPSLHLDPRRNAVRPDLADVRLADRVFAPHYAAPLPRTLTRAATLRSGRDHASEPLAQLEPGDVVEVLELSGGLAWGVAPGEELVGYIDAAALG